jgi:cytochrome c2
MLLWPGVAADAGVRGCLQCHKPHYTESGACISCHRGDERSNRLAIAHRDLIPAQYSWFAVAGSKPLQRGEKLLDTFACRRCHTTGGKGNRLASNLDRLPPPVNPQAIFQSIKSPALFMPDFRFNDQQMIDIVNAILAGERKPERMNADPSPQVVHFVDTTQQRRENVFEKQCGPCHKMLTTRLGALGQGSIGPNLSGLFSEFYPPSFKNEGHWTEDALKKWLENPRKIRENSQMRPVPLQKKEFVELIESSATKR